MIKVTLLWLSVVALIGLVFSSYLHTMLIGLTLAVVLYPLYLNVLSFCKKHFGGFLSARSLITLSANITEITALLVFVVGLLLPAMVILNNRHFLADRSMALYQEGLDWARSEKTTLSRWMDVPGWVDNEPSAAPAGAFAGTAAAVPMAGPARTGVGAVAVADQDKNRGLGNLNQLMSNLPPLGGLAYNAALCIGAGIIRMLVLMMIVHVALLYGRDLWGHIEDHTPQPWRYVIDQLGLRSREVLRAVYLHHGLTAVAAFLIAIPVFWVIFGQPYFFLAAVLAGLFQFIPLLGSSVLVTGMTCYLFLAGEPGRAWLCIFLALPLVVGVPDLVIRPTLARYQGRISPFTMLIGFMVGLEVMGPAGFVLGPLVLELFVCFTAIMLYGPDFENARLLQE